MENIEENTISTFRAGLNCSQAVVAAWSEKLGFDKEMALGISAGFGGGMGRLQETCGAVTGAFMVIGIYNSHKYPDNAERKEKSYAMVQEFNARFIEKHKSNKCKDLINCDLSSAEGRAIAKEENLHQTICEPCLATAVGILNDLIH
jgi:C_GCAxxG_C_C family probable redox protein